MAQPPVPKVLEEFVEEARAADSMEHTLAAADIRLQALLIKNRIERAYREQRVQKSGSYTLAEKYKLLDVFPPVVILTDTKIV
jgi:hypothetical protein